MEKPTQEVRPGPTEQLPMFMRGNDLIDTLTGTLDSSSLPVENVMTRKVNESRRPIGMVHGGGVYKAVAAEGVLSPVQLIHGVRDDRIMGQGHHRAAAAAEIEYETGKAKWVPVIHTDAREHSHQPYDNTQAGALDKLGVMADHREWGMTTSAWGADVGWRQKAEDAKSKPKPPYIPEKTPTGRL
jgi:hypothetical protein